MSMRKAALFAVSLAVVAAALIGIPRLLQSQGSGFQLVEATIEDVHRAIQDGSLTCQALVQAYVDRARAYDSKVSDRLVTEDGADIPPATGTMRAGAPLSF